MTTYSYTITLDDGELMALQAAIFAYRRICIERNNEVPYGAHANHLERINARLGNNPVMTSTSSFCWPEKQ